MSARAGDTILGRRLVGIGLAVYGAMSLGLILILLLLVLAPPQDDDGLLGLDGQRRQLLGVIDASARAIENAETAARGVDDTLLATGSAASSAAVLMNQLATTMRELAASLRISIFGSQPFVGPADQFDLVAGQAGRVAADLDLAAASIRLGATDMVVLADQLDALQSEVTLMRGRLDRPFDEGPWRLVAAAILAWLVVPALVSLWVGLRWSRPGAQRDREHHALEVG